MRKDTASQHGLWTQLSLKGRGLQTDHCEFKSICTDFGGEFTHGVISECVTRKGFEPCKSNSSRLQRDNYVGLSGLSLRAGRVVPGCCFAVKDTFAEPNKEQLSKYTQIDWHKSKESSINTIVGAFPFNRWNCTYVHFGMAQWMELLRRRSPESHPLSFIMCILDFKCLKRISSKNLQLNYVFAFFVLLSWLKCVLLNN